MIKKIKAISVRLRGIVKGNGSRGIETERAGEVEDIFGCGCLTLFCCRDKLLRL